MLASGETPGEDPGAQPTPAPAAPGQPTNPGGKLANTGAEAPWGVALAGGFLVVAGGLAFALRRRRTV
ncbi:LPXTG-motif cell wall-anchored protein [Microbacterium testaceum]|uniref:LPXTG cell wall anchor domain-containing protein n=1 Tax=Microbacterium testaceum TaxID=2033 RepID=UPI0027897220|nr:LPXTG cell wall anchor domain-containing protein [Microbacterium testaceum]MDQ1115637.1 LPXTG-motif cell wall-anchored protein [Microbacterium testaceum]